MDYRTGHLVGNFELVDAKKRHQYEELNAAQADLAKKLLGGKSEAKLSRQQARRLQRLADKKAR